jgi:hypothetical protein
VRNADEIDTLKQEIIRLKNALFEKQVPEDPSHNGHDGSSYGAFKSPARSERSQNHSNGLHRASHENQVIQVYEQPQGWFSYFQQYIFPVGGSARTQHQHPVGDVLHV